MRRKSHVRCGAGEKLEITSNSYLSLFITYTISIPNNGNVTAYNVVLIDTIPNGTVYVPGSLHVDGNPIGGTPASISVGTIPAGNTSVVTFKVQVTC